MDAEILKVLEAIRWQLSVVIGLLFALGFVVTCRK